MANLQLTKYAKMANNRSMNLVEVRKQNGLTQKEAAALIGVPYRTYIRYEQNESYQESYKYRMIMEDLSNKVRVDEEHGILSVNKIKEILIPILESHDIKICYLFGSYSRGEARENSDIDLLVDTDITGIEFFKLVEDIRSSLHKKIDLLRLKDLSNDNSVALQILKEGIKIQK